MSNLKTQNEALVDLILGILIFGILVVFVGLFVAPDKAAFVLGTVLGTAASVIRAVHMAVTLLSPQIHKYIYTRIFGKGR